MSSPSTDDLGLFLSSPNGDKSPSVLNFSDIWLLYFCFFVSKWERLSHAELLSVSPRFI